MIKSRQAMLWFKQQPWDHSSKINKEKNFPHQDLNRGTLELKTSVLPISNADPLDLLTFFCPICLFLNWSLNLNMVQKDAANCTNCFTNRQNFCLLYGTVWLSLVAFCSHCFDFGSLWLIAMVRTDFQIAYWKNYNQRVIMWHHKNVDIGNSQSLTTLGFSCSKQSRHLNWMKCSSF